MLCCPLRLGMRMGVCFVGVLCANRLRRAGHSSRRAPIRICSGTSGSCCRRLGEMIPPPCSTVRAEGIPTATEMRSVPVFQSGLNKVSAPSLRLRRRASGCLVPQWAVVRAVSMRCASRYVRGKGFACAPVSRAHGYFGEIFLEF